MDAVDLDGEVPFVGKGSVFNSLDTIDINAERLKFATEADSEMRGSGTPLHL